MDSTVDILFRILDCTMTNVVWLIFEDFAHTSTNLDDSVGTVQHKTLDC